jgi:glycosyltransferase involved in cell wall biosynthesis
VPSDELDILILGPVPPPFGGVSVHLSRFLPLLETTGLRFAVLNHFASTDSAFVVASLKRSPLRYYRLPKRFPARLVHYHHSRGSTLVAVALGRRKNARYVLTLHSPEIHRQLTSSIPFVARITKWALGRFDAIIVVNEKIELVIRDDLGGRPISILPAFLEAPEDEYRYETATEAFLGSGRLLLVPAYRVQFLDGEDMYGLDTAVEAFRILGSERQDLHLAVFLALQPSGRREIQYLDRLRLRLADAGLEDRVLFAFGLPLVPAFQHDVVVIRPTRTEGDAVSVREALQAGVPVVASDVVERPAGAVTFPAEDVEALCAAVTRVLDHSSELSKKELRDEGNTPSSSSFVDGILTIYRQQLNSLPPSRD